MSADPDAVVSVYASAADRRAPLGESDDAAEAFARAVAAKAWPRVLDIVESSWRTLFAEHHLELSNALLATPLPILRSRPLAWAVHNFSMLAPDPLHMPAPALIPTARLQQFGSGPEARYALDLSFAIGVVYRLRGLFQQAMPYVDQMIALARIAEATNAPDTAGILAGMHLHAGLIHQLRGEDDDAIAELLDAYRLAPASDQNYSLRDVTGKAALAHAMRGDMHSASTWLDREEASARATGAFGALVDSAGAVARAIVAVNQLAADRSSRALSLLEHGALRDELWAFMLHARALFVLGWGDRLGLLDELNQARTNHPSFDESRRNGGVAAPLLAAAEANLLMSLGRGNQAWVILNYGAEQHPLLDVARARLALLAGDAGAAVQIAREVIGDHYDSESVAAIAPGVVLDLLLVGAVALHRLGRRLEADSAMQAAIDLAGPERVFAFGLVPRRDLIELLDRSPQGRSLLTDDVLAQLPDVFPAGVSVFELTGQERLVLDGLANGKGLSDLAAELYVSLSTVKTHQRNLYRKLGVNSREDALAVAAELGLLSWPGRAGRGD